MEASLSQLQTVLPLAQLGAIFLQYVNENSQAIHNRPFALPGLHKGLLRERRSRAPSVENTDETSGSTLSHADAASEHVPEQERASPLEPNYAQIITNGPYVSRKLVDKSVVFMEDDLFRKNDFTPMRDQYLQWRAMCDRDFVSTSTWERLFAALRALDHLRNEEIGSMSLEMTYLFLFYQFRRLKISKEIVSSKRDRLNQTILKSLYPDEWDNMKEIVRRRHHNRLTGQLKIGRRWTFVVDRLSHGAVLLAGKKISTIIHGHDVSWKGLELLLTHITESYPKAVNLYKEADRLAKDALTKHTQPLAAAEQELTTLESLLDQGWKVGVP